MKDEAQKKVRRAVRVPASSTEQAASPIPKQTEEETVSYDNSSLFTLMRKESYPGEEGDTAHRQNEYAAIRSKELLLHENIQNAIDTIIPAIDEPILTAPDIDLMIPTDDSENTLAQFEIKEAEILGDIRDAMAFGNMDAVAEPVDTAKAVEAVQKEELAKAKEAEKRIEERFAEIAKAEEAERLAREASPKEIAKAMEADPLAEEIRLAELARAEARAKEAEAAELAQAKKRAEEARRAEIAKAVEAERLAKEAKRAEAARAAEAERLAEEAKRAEAARTAEAERLAKEAPLANAAEETEETEITFAPIDTRRTIKDDEREEEEDTASEPLTRKAKTAVILSAIALILALLAIGYAFLQNDTVSAYELSVGGKHLGYVSDKLAVVADYNALLNENQNVDARDLSFSEAAVPASAVLTQDEQTALLYTVATEGYVRGYTVCVDGETVAFALGEEEIQAALDTLLSIQSENTDASLLAGGTLKCKNELTWEYGYVKESDISDSARLVSILGETNRLSYLVERIVTVPEVLRYQTEFRENDEGFNGINTMISHGENGIAQTEYLQTVDPTSGEVLTSELQKTTVIREAVNAVSYYGKYPLLDESVCTDTFIFPLAEPDDNTWVIGTQVMSVPKIYLSSGYGERDLWGTYDFHLGYDIAALRGTEILACDGGIAVDVGYSDSYGYFVRLQHRNGVETMYAHMSERLVKEGEYVKQGQVIGLVGATGVTSGNHLHLEFRKDHVTCDPALYLEMPDWVLLEKDKDKYN